MPLFIFLKKIKSGPKSRAVIHIRIDCQISFYKNETLSPTFMSFASAKPAGSSNTYWAV
jgi:hypothetical protein